MKIETGIDPLSWTVGLSFGRRDQYIIGVFVGPLYLFVWEGGET